MAEGPVSGTRSTEVYLDVVRWFLDQFTTAYRVSDVRTKRDCAEEPPTTLSLAQPPITTWSEETSLCFLRRQAITKKPLNIRTFRAPSSAVLHLEQHKLSVLLLLFCFFPPTLVIEDRNDADARQGSLKVRKSCLTPDTPPCGIISTWVKRRQPSGASKPFL